METENNNDNFAKPEQYIQKIEELNGSIDLVLDEFKKTYIHSRMHPANEEIQQRFASMVASLNEIQSKLFSISNNVQVNIDDLNKKLFELDILIRREREKNKELKRKLGIVEHKTNSASEMIDDYRQIYDQKYLRNWALALSTIACIITIGSVFKKQGV